MISIIKNMKKIKAVILSLLIFNICILYPKTYVNAEDFTEPDYPIIQIEDLPEGWIVDENGNYINPSTGEYFMWTNSNERGSVAKNFSFYIRNSVTSSKFTINSTSVTVSCSANLVDKNNVGYDDLDGDGFDYYIKLTGVYSRRLDFNTMGTQSGTIDGLVDGGSYKITISTAENLPLDKNGEEVYLSGSGTVKNND